LPKEDGNKTDSARHETESIRGYQVNYQEKVCLKRVACATFGIADIQHRKLLVVPEARSTMKLNQRSNIIGVAALNAEMAEKTMLCYFVE